MSSSADGLEIISPVLRAEAADIISHTAISRKIDSLYTFLQSQNCLVEINDSCSTHIHVSCKGATKWSWEDARRVAVASFFWQRVIDCILGDERAKGEAAAIFCRRYPAKTREGEKMTLEKWISLVYSDKMTSIHDLVLLVNPGMDPKKPNEFDRYYRWNFNNLLIMGTGEPNKLKERKIGTIEFRGPPGSATAKEAMKWVQFTTYFVWAAIEKGSEEYFKDQLGSKFFENNKKNSKAIQAEFLKFVGLPKSLFPELEAAVLSEEAANVKVTEQVPVSQPGNNLMTQRIDDAITNNAL